VYRKRRHTPAKTRRTHAGAVDRDKQFSLDVRIERNASAPHLLSIAFSRAARLSPASSDSHAQSPGGHGFAPAFLTASTTNPTPIQTIGWLSTWRAHILAAAPLGAMI